MLKLSDVTSLYTFIIQVILFIFWVSHLSLYERWLAAKLQNLHPGGAYPLVKMSWCWRNA
jgi:hypothetical protein